MIHLIRLFINILLFQIIKLMCYTPDTAPNAYNDILATLSGSQYSNVLLRFQPPPPYPGHNVVATGYCYDLDKNLIFTIYDPNGGKSTHFDTTTGKLFSIKVHEKTGVAYRYNDNIRANISEFVWYTTVTKKEKK